MNKLIFRGFGSVRTGVRMISFTPPHFALIRRLSVLWFSIVFVRWNPPDAWFRSDLTRFSEAPTEGPKQFSA